MDPVRYWWESKMVGLLWKSVWWFLEFNIESPYDPAIPFPSVHMRALKAESNRHVYTSVHSIINHSSEKADTTQAPVHQQTGG